MSYYSRIPAKFVVFNSITEFLSQPWRNDMAGEVRSWTGPRDFSGAKDYLRSGAPESELKAARALVEKVDIEVHERHRDSWEPSPYGAYPVVPEYLAGEHMNMRTKVRIESPQAPVRIVMSISVAAGVNAGTIARRAAACAAFAMKLSEHRAVELWAASAVHNERAHKDVGWRAKLDMPMNLSQVVAVFDRAVCRVINYNVLETLSAAYKSNAGYPFELKGFNAYEGSNARANYLKAFREYMGLEPEDIVLDAGILTDVEEIDADPVKWVRNKLSEYGDEMES